MRTGRTASAQEIYERYVSSLPVPEQLRLLAMLAQRLATETSAAGLARLPAEPPRRSITELHGLGKEIWEGVDAQEYVDQLRDEWEQRERREQGEYPSTSDEAR
jgi:hypothetical protein